LDNARPYLSDHEIQANNLFRLFHPAYSPDFAPADFRLFGYLKVMLKGNSFETADEPQQKATDILMSSPRPIFRVIFKQWKKSITAIR
jgi:hypothetical protein